MANGASALEGSAFADRRACPRVRVALAAFLEAGEQRYSVQIADLSAGGAKLDCRNGLVAGTAAILHCGMLRRAGIVRWSTGGGTVGFCFDCRLEASDVAALVDRSNALEAWRNIRAR